MKHEVFAFKNLTVANTYTTYLDLFNMHVFKGQSLGILCDDFNEKTALLHIFEGEYAVPPKNVYFDWAGKKSPSSIRLFKKYFSVVGTERKVLPDFSVIDNMLLTPAHPGFLLKKNRDRGIAESLLSEFAIKLPLDARVSELTAAQKYMIELLRAFIQKKKIIVLTNMNDRFNLEETDSLLRLIEELKDKGITFLIMLDTPDRTLTDHTDELLILKNGRDIAQIETSVFHFSELYNYMLTGSIATPAVHTLWESGTEEEAYEDEDEPMVIFDQVSTAALTALDFCLYKEELIKIICSDQKSIYALRDMITGKDSVLQGAITIHNKPIRPRFFSSTVKGGIYWCPERPYLKLLFDNLSMIDNLLLGPMNKADKKYISDGLKENLKDYCQKHFPGVDYDRPVKEQNNKIRQELAFHKILLQAPKVLFIEKPFEETILGMNDITIRMIRQLQQRGTCIVILSMSISDAETLDGDTFYMKNGKMIDEMEMYAQRY